MEITSFQRNTIPAPPTIPAIAPARFVLFQNRENSISGPKVAPKPAQAKDTIWNITLSSSMAINIATMAMASSVIRDTFMTSLSVAFLRNSP